MPEAGRPPTVGSPLTGARETLEVEGTVREVLPNALFRVEIASGARAAMTAHVAGDSSLLRLRPATRWWWRSPPTTRAGDAS